MLCHCPTGVIISTICVSELLVTSCPGHKTQISVFPRLSTSSHDMSTVSFRMPGLFHILSARHQFPRGSTLVENQMHLCRGGTCHSDSQFYCSEQHVWLGKTGWTTLHPIPSPLSSLIIFSPWSKQISRVFGNQNPEMLPIQGKATMSLENTDTDDTRSIMLPGLSLTSDSGKAAVGPGKVEVKRGFHS